MATGAAVKRLIPGAEQNRSGSWIKDDGREFVPTRTEPVTDIAQKWQGWGTVLKPGYEPIMIAPVGELPVNVLTATDPGAFWGFARDAPFALDRYPVWVQRQIRQAPYADRP